MRAPGHRLTGSETRKHLANAAANSLRLELDALTVGLECVAGCELDGAVAIDRLAGAAARADEAGVVAMHVAADEGNGAFPPAAGLAEILRGADGDRECQHGLPIDELDRHEHRLLDVSGRQWIR